MGKSGICGMSPEDLCGRARSCSIQMTPARRKVLEAISALKAPFTTGSLEDEVGRRFPEVGRATVFRTIKLLRQAAILGQVHMGEGQDGYVVCQDTHHHHLICNSCGTVDELDGCEFGPAVDALFREKGFIHESHVLDIYGLCAKCAPGSADTSGDCKTPVNQGIIDSNDT